VTGKKRGEVKWINGI